MPSRRRLAVAAAVSLAMATAAAAATEPQPSSVQIFTSDYFSGAQPADAYDMVRKLPGFELIEGDEEVRGFTGSRGNILFDGRAPSGKQESLEQMLRRIPATSVLRIELIRGGSESAATGGYNLVANIVRRAAASESSASLAAGLSAADGIGVKPDFRMELSKASGPRRFEAAAALETDIDDDSGSGAIVESGSGGEFLGREDRDEREVERQLSIDAEYKLPLGDGDLVANANLARTRTNERVLSGEEGEASLATDRERLWSGEGALQFQTGIGSGELEALVSHRFRRLRARADEDEESFSELTRTSETIARFEHRRGDGALRAFASIEASLNRLTSDAELVDDGVTVPVSGSDVHVTEKRAEAALGAIWKPSESFTIEPSLRAEVSRIRSTGDSQQDDSFLFWKPRLRLSWARGPNHLQVTVEREAAQLDFEDFVASAELDRDDVTAGAVSLRPPTTWSISATYEWRFWDDGALLLTARNEWIDDVVDRVVVESDGELFDAVGNIGSGTRQGLRAELTFPFERLGITGLQFRAALTWLRSRVTDPVTGSKRIIAEDRPFEGELRLIYDLPGGRWSWGADASLAHHEREFRFDEARIERKGAAFGAYVEYRPRADWRFRIEADNVGSRVLTDARRRFTGSRASGVVDSIETRQLRTSPIFSFSARKSFGGD